MSTFNSTQTYSPDAVWHDQANVRAEFIRKTYVHLLGAVLAFVGLEAALFSSGVADRIATGLAGNWLLVLGAFVVVSWIASRAAHTATTLGAQYAALFGFVLAEAIIFVPLLYIAQKAAPGAIGSAALATIAGFACLTAIAFITQSDFSFLRGALMWLGVCALLLIVASVIFGWQLGTWFSVGMIAFAGAAILYDTSNVLHHYPRDRYVGAALELFASVALLFWYVLRIFIASRD